MFLSSSPSSRNDINNNGGASTTISSSNKRLRRSESPLPLLRRSSTVLSSSTSTSAADPTSSSSCVLMERAANMAARAAQGLPLTEDEVQDAVQSIQNIASESSTIDVAQLETFLRQAAHLSHKDWAVTDANSDQLCKLLFGGDSGDGDGISSKERFDELAPTMLERILKDGNWAGALQYSSSTSGAAKKQPWAVLVTGVNGIRKTTSMYQPWFPVVLEEALVVPPSFINKNSNKKGENDASSSSILHEIVREQLPTGQNSFFRQLDHMIATLCNCDFELLYQLTAEQVRESSEKGGGEEEKEKDSVSIISPEVIQMYTNLKAAIFSRYRTLSELLGALLLKQAQKRNLNCLMETSGKDIAMFHYVDHFFSASSSSSSPPYNKLALRFQINTLDLAKGSVDERMKQEIAAGIRAQTTQQVIASNQGGPYGSEVLPSIQVDSDAVWNNVVMKNGVGDDWFKATIQITAQEDKPWTAQAVRPDGSLGNPYEFQRN